MTARQRVGALAGVLALGGIDAASAQTAPSRSPTILWAQCPGQTTPPTTIAHLAEAARPVLWFSRDEPILESNSAVLPQEWPRTLNGSSEAKRKLAYYRIGRLKSSARGNLAPALRSRLALVERPFIGRNSAHPEVIAGILLDKDILDHLDRFSIRYFFYYPSEFGVGRHPHDFEQIDLTFSVEDADDRGSPWNSDRAARVCRQIRVSRFAGSAHGLGAYTNMLDLDEILREWFKEPKGTPFTDPFWPLLVFVEEGKHATAPDRNGDGVYTPGFDVNKYDSDAWGIRDTMRANRLAPAFTGDTFKRRIPEIKTDWKRQVSVANPESTWAADAFRRYVSHDYELRRATEDDEICGPPLPLRSESDRNRALREYDVRLRRKLSQENRDPGHPGEKIKERDFCNDAELDGSFDLIDIAHALRWGGSAVFARFGETFTVSIRHDNSVGWTAVSPMEIELPGVGGRIVGRATSEGLTLDRKGLWNLKSVDLLYMRSAAKFADFYLGVGVDDRRPNGQSPADRPDGAGRFDKALELGFRLRMPIPKLGVFLGGRIGVRSNDFSNLRNIRLVTEFGSAIW